MAFVVVALQTTRQLWNLTRSARLVPFGIPPWRLARLFWWLSSPGPPFLASILNLSVSGVLYLESYGHGVQIWYIVEFNMTLYARSTSEGYKRLIRLVVNFRVIYACNSNYTYRVIVHLSKRKKSTRQSACKHKQPQTTITPSCELQVDLLNINHTS